MGNIEALMQFGLTRQEANIYLVLMNNDQLTGYEVAKLTGISRSNTYTSLALMVDKGVAYLIEGVATQYLAVPLEEICNNRIRQLQESKTFLMNALPRIKVTQDSYITIKGERNIIDKMRNMLAATQERIYLSMSIDLIRLIEADLNKLVEEGRKVVVITDKEISLVGAVIYYKDKAANQIRLIIDSSTVLTGDITDGEYATCLYSQNKNLVDVFKEALRNEISLIEYMKGY